MASHDRRFQISVRSSYRVSPTGRILLTCLAMAAAINSVTASSPQTLAADSPIKLTDNLRLAPGKNSTIRFSLAAIPPKLDAVLVLHARLDTPRVAGYTPALSLTVNGRQLVAEHLIGRPRRALARNGRMSTLVAGPRFTTFYAPDFDSPDRHPSYSLLEKIKACEFRFRVTELLESGENVLEVSNRVDSRVDKELVVGDVRIEFRKLSPSDVARRPAPQGPLATFEPQTKFSPNYKVAAESRSGALRISVGGTRYVVASRFSTPDGKWVSSSNRFFRHERRVRQLAEAIVVEDSLTNLTGENLALMQRHEVTSQASFTRVHLAGIDRPTRQGLATEPANPTSFAATDDSGIGLIALNDVMRIHCESFAEEARVGIGDFSLALPPGGHYTAKWAIIPTVRPDYWEFINAARRLVGANFLIDGGFCFLRASPLTERWDDKQTRDFLVFKDVRYACAAIGRYQGRYAHGTAFALVDHEPYVRAFERRRRLVPGVKNLVYFHCFLDVLDQSPRRFADARVLLANGEQADYGREHQRLFFPRSDNSYGPEIGKNIDLILEKIGADGVYWDEHEYSAKRYHYGEPWDGVSCDIDRKRMTIVRLKSSVPLITQSWRVALAKQILSRGPLIGNGVPFTKSMAELQFPCFVETGSITNCTRAHLYSPIALGDHLTEFSEVDAYHVMLAALDFGCLYHWYNDMTVTPTHHHLTRYMYPITPLEIHRGYVIGRERIITKRSGLFGWGDASRHEVHLFDERGREVDGGGGRVSTSSQSGRTLSEIRLPESWSAAIVRRR